MKRKILITLLNLILISATLSGCTVYKQDVQDIPTPTYLQPTSVAQNGTLPEIDYSIQNGTATYWDMATDGKHLFMQIDGYGMASCNLDGSDIKQILDNQGLNYHNLEYSNGWLYFVAPDGIYKIRPDGKDKTRLYYEKDLVYDEDLCDVGMSFVEDDSLYYEYWEIIGGYKKPSLYCVKNGHKELIQKDFYFSCIYEGNIYYYNADGFLMKYDLSSKTSQEIIKSTEVNLSAIVDGIIYYLDEKNNICTYNLTTKEIKILGEKINFDVHNSVQFHNYILYMEQFDTEGDYISQINAFDIKTHKQYVLATVPTETHLEVCPTNACLYLKYNGYKISKLYFKDGNAIIEPMTVLNKALDSLY